jgi:hypothetical protein
MRLKLQRNLAFRCSTMHTSSLLWAIRLSMKLCWNPVSNNKRTALKLAVNYLPDGLKAVKLHEIFKRRKPISYFFPHFLNIGNIFS